MFHNSRFFAALLALTLLQMPVLIRAEDDKSADKTSADKTAADKNADKAAPAEVTTQGTVDVGGQKIAYTAIAGTLTVGATDMQDAQLGLTASRNRAASWP